MLYAYIAESPSSALAGPAHWYSEQAIKMIRYNYVLFEVLDGDLMIGLLGELNYE